MLVVTSCDGTLDTNAVETLDQVVCKLFRGRLSSASHAGMTSVRPVDVLLKKLDESANQDSCRLWQHGAILRS